MKSERDTHHLLCLLFVLESRGGTSQEMNAVAEPEYWVRHVAQAVRFFDAMKGCLARPIIEEWSLPSQGWLVLQTFLKARSFLTYVYKYLESNCNRPIYIWMVLTGDKDLLNPIFKGFPERPFLEQSKSPFLEAFP